MLNNFFRKLVVSEETVQIITKGIAELEGEKCPQLKWNFEHGRMETLPQKPFHAKLQAPHPHPVAP